MSKILLIALLIFTTLIAKSENLPSTILDKELIPAKIVYNEYNEKTNIYGFILDNGIRVTFKPTKFSKNRVLLKAFSFGGYSLYSVEDLDNAKKASSFVNLSGAGVFSNIDLSKILAGKNIVVKSEIDKLTDNIYGSADSQDTEIMFQLLYLRLTEPLIDSSIERSYKKELKDIARDAIEKPQKRFLQELYRWYYKNNPRVFFDTPKSIEKLNSNTMIEIFRDRFSDLNNFSFAIVGDIEVDKIEELIKKYLGSLPTIKRDECFVDRKIDYYRGEIDFNEEYNSKSISNILILYKTDIPYNQKDAMALEALVSILNRRVKNLIKKESDIYNITFDAKIERLEDKKSSATIKISFDPKRKDKLISNIYKNIDKIKKELISDKELELYKKKFKTSYNKNIKNNSYWLNSMINSFKFNTPLEEIYKIPNLVDNISKEDIRVVANKIFGKDILEAQLNPKRR